MLSAAFVCWRLLLLSLVIAPIAAVSIRWLSKMLKRANRRAMEQMVQIFNVLEETFRGIKIVKAFTGESYERKRFHLRAKEYYRKSMKIARYDSLSHPITEFMGILTVCLALLAGAWLVLKGEKDLFGIPLSSRPLDLSTLLLFYGFLFGTADPVRKFSDIFSRLQCGVAACDRVFALADREPAVRNPKNPLPCPRHRRELSLEGVSFEYEPGARGCLDEVTLANPLRRDDRHRRTQRLRQVDASEPHTAVCRPDRRTDLSRRCAANRHADSRTALADWLGHTGAGALRRHGLYRTTSTLRPPRSRRAARK